MNAIPLKDIDDNTEFWCGAKFRKFGTSLNIQKPEEDFYEYMLFLDSGMRDYMICAHIDEYERGSIVCYVKQTQNKDRYTVTAKEFKYSMVIPEELDDWYYLEDGHRSGIVTDK